MNPIFSRLFQLLVVRKKIKYMHMEFWWGGCLSGGFCGLFFLYCYPFWNDDLLALKKLVRRFLYLLEKKRASQPGDHKEYINDYWEGSMVENTLNEKINLIFRKTWIYKTKISKNLFDRSLIQTKLVKIVPFSSVYKKIPPQM